MQTDKPRELDAPPAEHPATLIAETDQGVFELERRRNATNLFWRPDSDRSRLVDERLMLIADTMRGLRRVIKGQNGRGNFDALEQGNGSFFICALCPGTYYGTDNSRTFRLGWLDEQDLVSELEGPAKQPQHEDDVIDAVTRHKRKLAEPRTYPVKPAKIPRRTTQPAKGKLIRRMSR